MKQLVIAVGLATCVSSQAVAAPSAKVVMVHYADLAHAMYEDSLITSRAMQEKINTLIAKPTPATLKAARTAWVEARHPYQQTEAYRFGNAIVDDWEGKVNAWPLDEGLVDYVTTSYGSESNDNPYYTVNVIANPELMLSGNKIDASTIDKALLAETLHEVDEVEANVATGYHAIEFLLWGQDLNGTDAGAGNRPASDFDTANCTGGNCDRRIQYLTAATDLLIDDLEWMVAQWADGGAARQEVTTGDVKEDLSTILTGMGSLSYGELAGERMKLGLMLHDPEEEQDCFSDNTHWSHYNDVLGIKNVYTGTYIRVDGSKVSGPSLSDLVANTDKGVDKALRASLDTTLDKMQVLVDSANDGEAYDQMIGADNPNGNAKVMAAINALLDQTREIEKAVNVMDLGNVAFAGSDSLDAPETIQ